MPARNGARVLEACPIDAAKHAKSVGLFVGSTRVFEQAGFKQVAFAQGGAATDAGLRCRKIQ
jgi:hypothetical protein